jgi:hypothetical protein
MTLSDVGQKAKTIVILAVCIPRPLGAQVSPPHGYRQDPIRGAIWLRWDAHRRLLLCTKILCTKIYPCTGYNLEEICPQGQPAAEHRTSFAIGQTRSRQSLDMYNLVSSVMIILLSFKLYFQGFSGLYYIIFRAVVPCCIGSAGSSGQHVVLPASHAALNTELRCQCLWRLYECISAVILSARLRG